MTMLYLHLLYIGLLLLLIGGVPQSESTPDGAETRLVAATWCGASTRRLAQLWRYTVGSGFVDISQTASLQVKYYNFFVFLPSIE